MRGVAAHLREHCIEHVSNMYRRRGGTSVNSENLPWAELASAISLSPVLRYLTQAHTPPSHPPSLWSPSPQLGLPLRARAGALNAGAGWYKHSRAAKYPVPLSCPGYVSRLLPSSAPSRHPAHWTVPCSAVAPPKALPKPCVTPLIYRRV